MFAAIVLSTALMQTVETKLVEKHGEEQRPRIHRGLAQVAQFWRAVDGDHNAFESFVTTNFAGDQGTLDALPSDAVRF